MRKKGPYSIDPGSDCSRIKEREGQMLGWKFEKTVLSGFDHAVSIPIARLKIKIINDNIVLELKVYIVPDARVKKRVSERVSPKVMHRIRSETLGNTLGETLGETFCAKQSRQESCRKSRIGSYSWLSARLSPRLVFWLGWSAFKINIDRTHCIKIRNHRSLMHRM